jgi:6-phosphogluconolactonase (cycloisomerase 2 family)
MNSGVLGALVPADPGIATNEEINYPGVAVTPAKDFLYALSTNLNLTQGFAINAPGLNLTPLANTPFAPVFTGPMNSLVLHPSGRFLYILHSPATIEEETVNLATGDLAFAADVTELPPADLTVAVIDPSGRFLYAADLTGEKVFGYQISQTDGALSAITGSPFPMPAGNLPNIEVIDSTGRFLYVALATRGIAGFSIDPTTGALTSVPGSPFPSSGTPAFLAADPVANFLYLCNSEGAVDGFAVDLSSGALTAFPGSPFTTAPTASDVAVDPLGKFVYVSNEARSAIFGFNIDSASGTLSAITGSPFAAVPQIQNLNIVKLP